MERMFNAFIICIVLSIFIGCLTYKIKDLESKNELLYAYAIGYQDCLESFFNHYPERKAQIEILKQARKDIEACNEQ